MIKFGKAGSVAGTVVGLFIAFWLPFMVLGLGHNLPAVAKTIIICTAILVGGLVSFVSAFFGTVIPSNLDDLDKLVGADGVGGRGRIEIVKNGKKIVIEPARSRSSGKPGDGFQEISGHVINMDKPIEGPTRFRCHTLEIEAGAMADIDVEAHVALLSGPIDGRVTFFGHHLAIAEGAVLTGDLTIRRAHTVEIEGQVQGEINGRENCFAFQDLRPQANSPDTPPA